MPDISIIIVNYNTADYLSACLTSILSQSAGIHLEIAVVDNASQDDSVSLVRNQFQQVHLIASRENLGFSKANNLATNLTNAKYIYYLNPDTEVKPKCLEAVYAFMENSPTVGMAGTRITYPDNTPQGSVETKYPGQKHCTNEVKGLPGHIAWLLGASLVARREVIEQVGGFTEDFFLYGEDIDLGLKIRQAGWKLGFIPDAEIVHWEGKSERNTLPVELFHKKLMAEALFYKKHYHRKTITNICQANIKQALWRIATLHLEMFLFKDPCSLQNKLDRYRLSLAFFRKLAIETQHS